MRTRRPHPSEPRLPGRSIYVRFGMTKGALVAVVLLTAAVGVGFWRLEVISNRGDQAARALCAVKESTRQQIRASVQFLTDIRTGKRPAIRGISEADILTGISRQQKFLHALDDLHC